MNQRTKIEPAATDADETADDRTVIDLRDHQDARTAERGNGSATPIEVGDRTTSRFSVDWAPPDR